MAHVERYHVVKLNALVGRGGTKPLAIPRNLEEGSSTPIWLMANGQRGGPSDFPDLEERAQFVVHYRRKELFASERG